MWSLNAFSAGAVANSLVNSGKVRAKSRIGRCASASGMIRGGMGEGKGIMSSILVYKRREHSIGMRAPHEGWHCTRTCVPHRAKMSADAHAERPCPRAQTPLCNAHSGDDF